MELYFETPVTFQDFLVPKGTRLVGWAALVHALALAAPVRKPSCVSVRHVRGSLREEKGWRIFDKRYYPGASLENHVGFALRHESIDFLVLKRVLDAVPAVEVENIVRSAPTGASARRLWFYYESLTGKRLDLEDAPSVTAVDALDPRIYFTGQPRLSRRHRIRDNSLGSGSFCPIIRRTEHIETFIRSDLARKAAETLSRTDSRLGARAVSSLLLADCRASFEIEGERPPRSRLERWGRAVLQAGRNSLSLDEFNRLHNVLIEDTRFISPGLRPDDVFLGERDRYGEPMPEFTGARANDLDELIAGLLSADERMRESALDPVLHAAATAFGFVYIHPFQDGNGRVHRCLIHHILAERAFTPPGMVFPVSAVMLDRIGDYDRILRTHSRPLMDLIEWRATPERNVEVLNDTADLFRYFDCTEAAQFLYECVSRTVKHDLPDEIDRLQRQDKAQRRIMGTVEMPVRMAQNLLMFMHQNAGAIPKRRRRKQFRALTDDEVREIEAIYREVYGAE